MQTNNIIKFWKKYSEFAWDYSETGYNGIAVRTGGYNSGVWLCPIRKWFSWWGVLFLVVSNNNIELSIKSWKKIIKKIF